MTEGNKAIAVGAFFNLFLSLIKFAGGFLAIALP
jgi:divalent metal cation (Fe/Co/Zn/Cd) transporter